MPLVQTQTAGHAPSVLVSVIVFSPKVKINIDKKIDVIISQIQFVFNTHYAPILLLDFSKIAFCSIMLRYFLLHSGILMLRVGAWLSFFSKISAP